MRQKKELAAWTVIVIMIMGGIAGVADGSSEADNSSTKTKSAVAFESNYPLMGAGDTCSRLINVGEAGIETYTEDLGVVHYTEAPKTWTVNIPSDFVKVESAHYDKNNPTAVRKYMGWQGRLKVNDKIVWEFRSWSSETGGIVYDAALGKEVNEQSGKNLWIDATSFFEAGLNTVEFYHYNEGDGIGTKLRIYTSLTPTPSINITHPEEEQTVGGTVIISGTASVPDGAVQKVEVRIDDGDWQLADGTTSWTFEWDTETVGNGWQTIFARSYDGATYSETCIMEVYVDNPTPSEIFVDDDFADDPANHKWNTIQEGVDDANDGDSVYVYGGTYYENIEIDRRINLIGERRDTAIIDCGEIGGDAVVISESWVNVSNFVVKGHSQSSGVYSYYSSNIKVTNCTIIGCSWGIFLYHSSNSIILNCTVSNNYYGIWLGGSSNNNRIHHNNLTDNTIQAYDECSNFWDNGYPSGGNCWNDYTGSDLYSGENQDQPGSDGIGDVSYLIPGGTNEDHYPLVSGRANTPPTLTSISFSMYTFPRSAIPDIFKVTYTDIDNNPPSYIKVIIDGIDYEIDVVTGKEEIDDDNYTDGVTYYANLDVTATAPTKTVSFYFACSDGVSETSTEEQTIDVFSSGFTPQEDGYSFKNDRTVFERPDAISKISSWSLRNIATKESRVFGVEAFDRYVNGLCYGMSYTSVLYYQDKSKMPAGKTRVYDLNITADEGLYENILRFHYTQPLTMRDELVRGLSFEEKGAYYDLLKNQVKNGPWVLGVSYRDEEGNPHSHAVVVYKIVEAEYWAYLYVYDPNSPYGVDGDEYSVGKVNLFTWSFDYGIYDEFSVLKPEDIKDKTYFEFNFIAIAHSPVEVHVYDENDNHVGLDDEGKLEVQIPGAHIITVDNNLLFVIPETAGNLRWVIKGTGSGLYSFELSIPTKEDCLRVYTVNTTTTPDSVDTLATSSEGKMLEISTVEKEKVYSLTVESLASTSEAFTLTQMAIDDSATHSYTVNDWDNLETGSNPLTLGVDEDSDGAIEHDVDLRAGMKGEDVEGIIRGKEEGGLLAGPFGIPWLYVIIPLVIVIFLAGVSIGIKRGKRAASPNAAVR